MQVAEPELGPPGFSAYRYDIFGVRYQIEDEVVGRRG